MNDFVSRVSESYEKHGFGGRVGFGTRPAVVVIDLAGGWTDSRSTHGSQHGETIQKNVELLASCRQAGVPIYFTSMAFNPGLEDLGQNVLKKLPHQAQLIRGTDWVELHPALERREEEPIIYKPRASAFFGTPLLGMLVDQQIDTVLITGCSTSGCIRATAESAHNYGFHAIVIKEAVGDRSSEAHQYNLVEIDARYADVTPLEEVKRYIQGLKRS